MMQSMTGMGRAQFEVGSKKYQIEIKSVNHRFIDFNTYLPPVFQEHETFLIGQIKKRLERGRVNVWIGESKQKADPIYDEKALVAYHQFLKKVANLTGMKQPVQLSHLMQGSQYWMKASEPTAVAPKLKQAIGLALDQLLAMRSKEGQALEKNIQAQLKKMGQVVERVHKLRSKIKAEYQKKIKARLAKLLDKVELDQARLAQEVAYLVDRTDITEEIDRLHSHLKQFKKAMNSQKSCGRKLDFLSQEINRELNTIGSKAQDVQIAHDIVDAKSMLEKIREQIQNIQ